MSRAVVAEELYTFAELCQLLKIGRTAATERLADGVLLAHDHVIPGAGAKGRRWSATRVREIQERWRSAAIHEPWRLTASQRGYISGALMLPGHS